MIYEVSRKNKQHTACFTKKNININLIFKKKNQQATSTMKKKQFHEKENEF